MLCCGQSLSECIYSHISLIIHSLINHYIYITNFQLYLFIKISIYLVIYKCISMFFISTFGFFLFLCIYLQMYLRIYLIFI